MGIQRPQYANVSLRLLEAPPLSKEFTTRQLNTLLTVVNCAQQVVANNWDEAKGRGKDYWRERKSISFVLQLDKLCSWCACSRKRLEKRLGRLKQPIGLRSSPVQKYKIYPNSVFSHDSISLTLDMSWVHTTDYYSQVGLPVPQGNRTKCATHLLACLPEPGMSKRSPMERRKGRKTCPTTKDFFSA